MEVRSPSKAKDFSSSLCVQTGSGAHPASCTWVPGVLSMGVKRGRGVMLTTHPHLVPRSWMRRSYTYSPPKRLPWRVSGLQKNIGYVAQWPRGLRRRSGASWLLGSRVRIPLRVRIFVTCVYMLCCPVYVEAYATGWSLVQRSPTVCLIVCVITETPKGALCSSWGPRGKLMIGYVGYMLTSANLYLSPISWALCSSYWRQKPTYPVTLITMHHCQNPLD
jgi:hypothetical protein